MNLEEKQDEAYKKAIIAYLNNRIKTDEYLRAACEKGNKTLDGVIAYIKSEARKQAKDGVAMIPDENVYGWAVHYILEDSLDFEIKNKVKKLEPDVDDSADTEESEKCEPDNPAEKQKKSDGSIRGQLDLF
jgi:hypothetical protein